MKTMIIMSNIWKKGIQKTYRCANWLYLPSHFPSICQICYFKLKVSSSDFDHASTRVKEIVLFEDCSNINPYEIGSIFLTLSLSQVLILHYSTPFKLNLLSSSFLCVLQRQWKKNISRLLFTLNASSKMFYFGKLCIFVQVSGLGNRKNVVRLRIFRGLWGKGCCALT